MCIRDRHDTSRQYQIGQSGIALEPLGFPTICTGLVQMSVPWRSGPNVRFHPHLTIGQHINDHDMVLGPLFHNQLRRWILNLNYRVSHLGIRGLPIF